MYICTTCGEASQKWQGKCLHCNTWGSLERGTKTVSEKSVNLTRLSDIQTDQITFVKSIPEFDQVCGGGLAPKGVILLGGEPGIGKSTLLLQICDAIQSARDIIYIAGEEAPAQIRLRADRLGISPAKILCLSIVCVESIVATLEEHDPVLVIVDSIQTMFSKNVDGSSGSINQMRACSNALIHWAKESNATLIIVGHVTKDGALAGPKVIEHMVDTVLSFEGERGGQSLRILRTIKNRYGSTDTIGVFEIGERGLSTVKDVAQVFLKQRAQDTYGSSIFASIDGNRTIFVELQALIATSYAQSPTRSVVGWELSRLRMLIAILESTCGTQFGNKEVYLNVIAGLKIIEPGADMAVALAILSAHYKIPIPLDCVALGEVSLSGEIRSIPKIEQRLAEGKRLGFRTFLGPKEKSGIIGFLRVSDLVPWLKSAKMRGAN